MTAAPLEERSAAVVLAPALLLVVLALAVVAVDLSVLHHAHRNIHRVVATAADDAAGLIDGHHLHATGDPRIDAEAATRFVRSQIDQTHLPGRLVGPPRVTFDDAGSHVTVQVSVDVDHIVARSVATRRSSSRLNVTASARMVP